MTTHCQCVLTSHHQCSWVVLVRKSSFDYPLDPSSRVCRKRDRKYCPSLLPLAARLATIRCERSKLTYTPCGFSVRATCRIASRCLKLSNFTTTVYGLPEWLLPPVLWTRSILTSFACCSDRNSYVTNVFRMPRCQPTFLPHSLPRRQGAGCFVVSDSRRSRCRHRFLALRGCDHLDVLLICPECALIAVLI